MHGDIDLEVLHPVPVRWAPRPGSAERLWFHDVATPVSLRAVPPGSMRPIAPIPDLPLTQAYEHEGHVWHAFETLGPDYKARRRATVGEAVDVLAGAGPMVATRPLALFSSPLFPGDGILRDKTPATGRRTVPDRALAKAVEDLSGAARARVREHFADEIRHDGTGVYVRVSPPLPHAFCLSSEAAVPVELPGNGYGWAGAAGGLAHREPYLALVRELVGPERADATRSTYDRLAPFGGLGDPDVDVACFLSQTPHFLWKSWLALDARHAPDPDAAGARGVAEAALATLRPLAARAAGGMLGPADHPAAAEAVHDMAVALRALWPDHGLRTRLVEVARFVEAVVQPRLEARDPESASLDAALSGLAR